MGGGLPKQYRLLGGKAVLRHAVEAFVDHPRVDRVAVAIAKGHEELADQALAGLDVTIALGGSQRSDSVRNGLSALRPGVVLVHDAARPFCPPRVIDRLLQAVSNSDCAVPVLPAADTLARGGEWLEAPVDRAGLVRVQTPQACHTNKLMDAFSRASGSTTDESTLMLAAGFSVATVEGDPMLDKLTLPSDWDRAEAHAAVGLVPRTGLGFDVHAFGGEGPIMLGGVPVPFPRGLAGHSDADVVLHAITDALLGAAGLGDIGQHFPPSDVQWKGAASDIFLSHAAELIRDLQGIIDHVDCTVIGEEPKVGPHRSAIRDNVAHILKVNASQVSIKATTTERLGFTGRGEGLAAQAVANIRLRVAG
ncbi:2-C-methyl-D-erythritol 2,4-cyclodiphosphate synthase [Sphingomonas piscis]|nr:2-C-methyl-D-erythritol 2,4-cyclodiphosphate synthase [Sphingomonas piscis]